VETVEGHAELGLLLVEDDSMVRSWVRLALQGSEFRLAGEAGSAGEALDLASRRNPDLFLIDYRLPDGVGTQLVRQLRERGVQAPAVVMTANPERGFNEAAREGGAQGTTLKSGSAVDLLETLRAVARGELGFDSRHPPRPSGRGALSPREREVVRLVAGGSTNREVAAALGVGEETVKTLLARTYAKLGVRRRAEAVAEAQKQGLL
jgi:DNA-binding NarL/FixJ family response regulator